LLALQGFYHKLYQLQFREQVAPLSGAH
jgi:hypothetical protein